MELRFTCLTQTGVPTDFSSCGPQLDCQDVSKSILSHELDSKSDVETFLATTSAFGRVRHSHIRLSSSVVSIGSSSIVGGSWESGARSTSVRDSPPDAKTTGRPSVVFKVPSCDASCVS